VRWALGPAREPLVCAPGDSVRSRPRSFPVSSSGGRLLNGQPHGRRNPPILFAYHGQTDAAGVAIRVGARGLAPKRARGRR
jgi:hypothetical protein